MLFPALARVLDSEKIWRNGFVTRRVDERRIEVVDDAVAEVLRRKTPAERIEMVLNANRLMRLRIEGHLRTRHPDWDDAAVHAEIARRMLLGSD